MAPVRRTFTIKEKVDIISRLKNGESNADLCKELNVPHSTISSMWKNRSIILECFGDESKSLNMKKNRKPNHQDIDSALLLWFKDQRCQNVPISGRQLQEKANYFAKLIGKTNFDCSESWIYRFRQRHDFVVSNVCGEVASVSRNYCENWLKIVLPKLTEEYTESQIWNADETGFFFKLTPERTVNFEGEKCIDGKLSKDRITVLVASSMAGEKRKLLVIGKKRKPKCFKNVKTLPVDYEANERAWLTSDIFKNYLQKWDSELRKDKKKIILFIDNCPAHMQIDNLTNIKLAFLPLNATSVIQPINQGVIKTLKGHYRLILMQKMINAIEKNTSFSVSLLDAIEMITTAWARVNTDTIKKCFVHAGFYKSSNITEIDEGSDDELDVIPLAQLAAISSAGTNVVNWESFVNIDNQVTTSGNLTDNEIIEEDAEEEGDCNADEIPTIKEALGAVTVLKRYCLFGDAKDNIDIEAVMKLEHTLHRSLAQKSNIKQCNIRDFFKKP